MSCKSNLSFTGTGYARPPRAAIGRRSQHAGNGGAALVGIPVGPEGTDDLRGCLRGVALGENRHHPLLVLRRRLEDRELAVEQLLGAEVAPPGEQPPGKDAPC